MATITKAVGRGVVNPNIEDVKLIQRLLNAHRQPPLRPIAVDGKMGSETITAIEEFQHRVVRMPRPDGKVDVHGSTIKALSANQGLTGSPSNLKSNLSGASWWHANQAKYTYSYSKKVEDLEPGFRAKVQEFIAALESAGATVTIDTTRRSKERAYLMHYAWRISRENLAPAQVPLAQAPMAAFVDIIWDHGDLAKSRQAAGEMVQLFSMADKAALTTLHIEGKAIDMNISWTGTLSIKNKAGQTVNIGAPRNGGDNTTLHKVGATYGVIKLVKIPPDDPHWSATGN